MWREAEVLLGRCAKGFDGRDVTLMKQERCGDYNAAAENIPKARMQIEAW